MRFASRLTLAGRPARLWVLVAIAIAFWAGLAFVYWRPLSIHVKFLNDSFVFYDGIHRILRGQMPHIDFSTPVGALSYWLPKLGFTTIGGYAGAVEVGSLILAAATLPLAVILLAGRASVATAALVLGTVAGILVVPLIPGWSPSGISSTMHYNRWGWGLLLTLLLMALNPPDAARAGSTLIHGLAGGLLITGLFYIKITYFLVGMAFLLALAIYPDTRRREAIYAAGVTVLGLLLSSLLFPGLLPAYVADIRQALTAGDGAARDPYYLHALTNRNALLWLMIAVYAALLRNRLVWQDIAVTCFILVTALAIIDQNFQFKFLVSLIAAFAVLATNGAEETHADRLARSVVLAAGFAMVLPFTVDWAQVTLKHLTFKPGDDYATLAHPDYENVYFAGLEPIEPNGDPADYVSLDGAKYLRGQIPQLKISERDYLQTLIEGAALLDARVPEDAVIVTFDYSNTLAPLVDAPREPYGLSWVHFGRNIKVEDMPPPVRYFSGVDYVMVPKRSRYDTGSRLVAIYGAYLLNHSTQIAQTDSWILLKLEQAEP